MYGCVVGVYVEHMYAHFCQGQRTVYSGQLSPPVVWVLGIRPGLSEKGEDQCLHAVGALRPGAATAWLCLSRQM